MKCQREGCDKPAKPKPPGVPGPVARFCSQNCQRRAWDAGPGQRYCVDCGDPLGIGVHPGKDCRAELCRGCYKARRTAEHTERVEHAARLYNDGVSQKDIARALGFAEGSGPGMLLRDARRRGLIGYRNRGYEKQAA